MNCELVSVSLVVLVSGSAVGISNAQQTWGVALRAEANSPSADDNFGCAVSVNGEWAAVGAQQDDVGQGYVKMYRKTTGVWAGHSELTNPTGGATDDNFGHAVAVSGNYLAVGAFRRTSTTSNCGVVYIYEWSGSSWGLHASTPVLTAQLGNGTSDKEANASFGYSVALNGSLLVVGSPHKNESGADEGAVYVYNLASGSWQIGQKLTIGSPYSGDANDYFGWAVATNGATILVGAPGDDAAGTDTGACYEYKLASGSWALNAPGGTDARLTAGALLGNRGQFGFSVSSAVATYLGAADDTVYAIGSLVYDDGQGHIFKDPDVPGSAFINWRNGSNAWQVVELIPSGSSNGDTFGASAAIGTDGRVVVGGYQSPASSVDNGQAFIFNPGSTTGTWIEGETLNPTSPVSAGGSNHVDWFGRIVAIDGTSVNSTILVGSHFGDTNTGSTDDVGIAYFVRPSCYPNCDGSTASPVLNANDFQCFIDRFASNDPWANCDGSTGTPLLTSNDFQCFLNKYNAGCS